MISLPDVTNLRNPSPDGRPIALFRGGSILRVESLGLERKFCTAHLGFLIPWLHESQNKLSVSCRSSDRLITTANRHW